jgi:hypothetical protein
MLHVARTSQEDDVDATASDDEEASQMTPAHLQDALKLLARMYGLPNAPWPREPAEGTESLTPQLKRTLRPVLHRRSGAPSIASRPARRHHARHHTPLMASILPSQTSGPSTKGKGVTTTPRKQPSPHQQRQRQLAAAAPKTPTTSTFQPAPPAAKDTRVDSSRPAPRAVPVMLVLPSGERVLLSAPAPYPDSVPPEQTGMRPSSSEVSVAALGPHHETKEEAHSSHPDRTAPEAVKTPTTAKTVTSPRISAKTSPQPPSSPAQHPSTPKATAKAAAAVFQPSMASEARISHDSGVVGRASTVAAPRQMTKSQAARVIQREWRRWRLAGQRHVLRVLARQAAALRGVDSRLAAYLHTSQPLLSSDTSGFEWASSSNQQQQLQLTPAQRVELNELAMRVLLALDECGSPREELRALRKQLARRAVALQDKVCSLPDVPVLWMIVGMLGGACGQRNAQAVYRPYCGGRALSLFLCLTAWLACCASCFSCWIPVVCEVGCPADRTIYFAHIFCVS